MTETITKPSTSPITIATGLALMACLVGIIYLFVNPFAKSNNTPQNEAEDAKAYLREKNVAPLSGPLKALLDDTSKPRIATEQHALLNQPAPAFNLADVDGNPVVLETLTAKGPVIVVFYYGYVCNHCVAQLFGINDDLKYFHELGATVVAISPDTAAHTKERYTKYGAFGFPVVCDKDRSVASRYGVFRPKLDKTPEWQAHGTFLIDARGIIRWINTGDEPFTSNVTLLAELAKLKS